MTCVRTGVGDASAETAWAPPLLGCARCGDCCSPVKVDFHAWARAVADARRFGSADETGGVRDPEQWANCLFIAEHWQPIGYDPGEGFVLLRCRFYDLEHQACTAYGQRPEICSGFPWYGRTPPATLAGETRCSYWLDVPPALRPEGSRPLIPLTVLSVH